MQVFKDLDQKKYNIWTDAGNHFRCGEMIHYLFKELADEQIRVCYNLFAECHGKSSRDQHFSVLGYFIADAYRREKLISTSDVISAIQTGQAKANERRVELAKDPIHTLVFEHRPNVLNHLSLVRTILHLRTYYNFYNDEEFKLFSTIYTDLLDKNEINYIDSCTTIEKIESKKRPKSEITVPSIPVELSRLKRKRGRISDLLEKKSSIGSKKTVVNNHFLGVSNSKHPVFNLISFKFISGTLQ